MKTEFKTSPESIKEIVHRLKTEFKVEKNYINNIINLHLGGATKPFIARYRKEMTGKMSEDLIHKILARFNHLNKLEEKKESIIESINEQNKLNPALLNEIKSCSHDYELEDLYIGFKPKTRTKASIARKKGMEPLAIQIYVQKSINKKLDSLAKRFVDPEKGYKIPEEALKGASNIITEWISEDPECRVKVRELIIKGCTLTSRVCKGTAKSGSIYEDFFDFSQNIDKIPFFIIHKILRGESEGILKCFITADRNVIYNYMFDRFIKTKEEDYRSFLEKCVIDAFENCIFPSLEGEIKKELKNKADEKALEVSGKNFRILLLSTPAGNIPVMGIKPGLKKGCKIVVLDGEGIPKENLEIFPHPPKKQVDSATRTLQEIIEKYDIKLIVLGNGGGSSKTEKFLKDKVISDREIDLKIVDESIAATYSTSKTSEMELTDLDPGFRIAVFIGRYIQNPINEIVKVDPVSISSEDFKLDVDRTLLEETLNWVISSCVNFIGIDLNRASYYLLRYTSGIDEETARNITSYRDQLEEGFSSRKELMKVPGITPKIFEQSAGFLRIKNGSHPLDATFIHPESYHIISRIADKFKCRIQDLIGNNQKLSKIKYNQFTTKAVGFPTIRDIIYELGNPDRDPRKEIMSIPVKQNTKSYKDLVPGTILNGKVTNLTNFGVFVDIGVGVDGFVHISQISNKFVKDPSSMLSQGEIIKAKVISVDPEKKRISLSIKQINNSPK